MKNNYIPLTLCFGLMMVSCFLLRAQTDPDPTKVDNDGDGLIEIWNLTQLDHMRHNLAGTSYKATSGGAAVTTGCGTSLSGAKANACHGYELMADLDFRAGCGEEGTAASACTHPAWVPLDNADPSASGARTAAPASGLNSGWVPVGTSATSFTGTFDGNGFQIKNLYINATASSGVLHAGLFGYALTATIQNLGLTGEHMLVKGTNTGTGTFDGTEAGSLVGQLAASLSSRPIVRNCYATGDVIANAQAAGISVGGLVGITSTPVQNPVVRNCYATGDVTGSSQGTSSQTANVGGLAGLVSSSTISGCYATGDVEASGSATKHAGGLSGRRSRGSVAASYHAGTVTGATESGIGTAKTLAKLRTPTGAEGIYSAWSTNSWDFGGPRDLPRLRTFIDKNADGDNTDANEQGIIIAGQPEPLPVTPDEIVAELRQLVADHEADRSATGDDYLRVKKLVDDLTEVRATQFTKKEAEGKADASKVYTKTEADGKYALKTDLDAPKADIAALKAAVGAVGDAADGTGSLYARVAQNKSDLAGKAEASVLSGYVTKTKAGETYLAKTDAAAIYLTKAAASSTYALASEVGEKPASGTADTLWEEVAAVKSAIPAATNISGKADKATTYTRTVSNDRFLQKTDLPNLADYVPKADFDALKKRIEALQAAGGGGGNGSAWATAWLETRVVVRPNPVRDRLLVESPVAVAVSVMDAQGRGLLSAKFPTGGGSLDVSGLRSGGYLVVLQAKEGGVRTYKFVKE